MKRLALGAVIALVAAGSASAKGSEPFDRASARPGDTIRIGGGLFAANRVRVWLLPIAAAGRWWPNYDATGPSYGLRPTPRAAVPLGILARPRATISVVVPRVRPGRYVLAYWQPATGARWTSARLDFVLSPRTILRVTR